MKIYLAYMNLKNLSRKHEKVTSKCLEEARKSFGTDEDLLLVSVFAILLLHSALRPSTLVLCYNLLWCAYIILFAKYPINSKIKIKK